MMHGLNTYDYGARQYYPLFAQWDRVDPLCEKYYNVSPYAYCHNNPINFVDMDGRDIVISGNRQERLEVLKYMQSLTNDKLGVKQNGQVVILSSNSKNKNKSLKVGTGLISSMISNKHTATISLGNRNSNSREYRRDAINGKGTNVSISFNPNHKPVVLTKDNRTGESLTQTIPNEIVLGHEMIHGYRSMNGEASDGARYTTYTYKDSDGGVYRVKEKAEELQTIGIIDNYKYTENKLREEQGYNKRIEY